MILIGVQDQFQYIDGKKTPTVCGVKAHVLLPGYDYARLSIKLPLGTDVPENFMGKAVEFPGFSARVYSISSKLGFSVTALGITLAKT